MTVLCGFGIGVGVVLLTLGLFGVAITMADDDFVFMVIPAISVVLGIALLIISCIGYSSSIDNNNKTTQESNIVETIDTTPNLDATLENY